MTPRLDIDSKDNSIEMGLVLGREMLRQLYKAKLQFEFYANEHSRKGLKLEDQGEYGKADEARQKAQTNYQLAFDLQSTISRAENAGWTTR